MVVRRLQLLLMVVLLLLLLLVVILLRMVLWLPVVLSAVVVSVVVVLLFLLVLVVLLTACRRPGLPSSLAPGLPAGFPAGLAATASTLRASPQLQRAAPRVDPQPAQRAHAPVAAQPRPDAVVVEGCAGHTPWNSVRTRRTGAPWGRPPNGPPPPASAPGGQATQRTRTVLAGKDAHRLAGAEVVQADGAHIVAVPMLESGH